MTNPTRAEVSRATNALYNDPPVGRTSSRFGAVGNDAGRQVVWGLGATEAKAIANGKNELAARGRPAQDLTVVALTDEEAAAVWIGQHAYPVVPVTCAPCTAHADCDVDRVIGLACSATRESGVDPLCRRTT